VGPELGRRLVLQGTLIGCLRDIPRYVQVSSAVRSDASRMRFHLRKEREKRQLHRMLQGHSKDRSFRPRVIYIGARAARARLRDQ